MNLVELLILGAARELAMRSAPQHTDAFAWTRWLHLTHCARIVESEGCATFYGYEALARCVDGVFYAPRGVDGHA